MKIQKRIIALTASAAMMISAGGASAAVYIDYSADGNAAKGPVPGTFTASGEVSQNAQLITAVYDTRTDKLEKVTASEQGSGELSTVTDIDTLDGYSIKHFIWNSLEGMIPLEYVQEQNTVLEGKYAYEQTVLTWDEITPGRTASYSVACDGNVIAQGISVDTGAYTIEGAPEAAHTYRILSVDANGKIIGSSNAVTVGTAEDEESGTDSEYVMYTFDPETASSVKEGSADNAWHTYSAGQSQIYAGGKDAVVYSEENSRYQYSDTDTYNVGDGGWFIDTVDGKKSIATTSFYNQYRSPAANQNGCINFLLGSEYVSGNRVNELTIEYYDEGTSSVVIRYMSASGSLATTSFAKTGTNTWKTITITLYDGLFNGNARTGLFDGYADFRLESGGRMLHIGKVTLKQYNTFNPTFSFDPAAAEPVQGSFDMNSFTYGSEDRQLYVCGIGSVFYDETLGEYNTTHNIGDGNWMLETVDGKASITTGYYRINSTTTARYGYINFKAGKAYTSSNNTVTLVFEYLDEATSPFYLQYYSTSGVKTLSYPRTGTNEWRSKVVVLNDANFNSGANTGLFNNVADFRFGSGSDNQHGVKESRLHIGRVTLEQRDSLSEAQFEVNDNVNATLLTLDSGSVPINQYYNDSTDFMIGGSPYLSQLSEPVYNGSKRVDYTFEGTGDNGIMFTEIGGKKAVMTAYYNRPNRPSSAWTPGFIYCFLGGAFSGEDTEYTVTLEYFDNSNGNIGIQYVNGPSLSLNTVRVPRKNTNTWKTAEFKISDGHFNTAGYDYLMDGNSDFRIVDTGSAPVYIHSVSIRKGIDESIKSKDANTLYPDGVSAVFTSGDSVENGLTFGDGEYFGTGADGMSMYVDIDGTKAVSTTSFGIAGETINPSRFTFLYFDIDEKYMYGSRDSYAEFEIEYYDSTTNRMVLHYNTEGTDIPTAYREAVIGNQTGTNTWKTATVKVKDACFTGRQNQGMDFRLGLNNSTSSDQQFIVKSVKVKNVSHRTIAHSDNIPTVYLAGDSIVANYTSGAIVGWGMKLPDYIDAEIVNYAVPGASTKTFASFDTINDKLFKNDYVLLHFAHNDSMSDSRGVTLTQYRENLTKRITEILEKQAIPVIVTSIPTYTADGVMDDNIDVYRNAEREVAAELNVPLIELNGKLREFLGTLGTEEALTYFVDESTETNPNARRVHLSAAGAEKAAQIIAQEISQNDKIRVLKDLLK